LQLVRPRKFLSWKRRWIFGASVHVLVFCFAFSLTNRRTEITDLAHFSNQEGVTEYLAFLDNSIQEKKKSFKVIIEVIAVKKSNGWNLAKGKCLLYIAIDSIASSLEYGDLISFKTSPVIVKPPANPEQFNYKQWLAYNQVYQQLYLQKGQWQLKGHQYGNSLVAIAIRMREKLLQIFRDNGIAGDEYAVLSALLLGATGEIDQEVMSAYSASGAMHVLSVSGLHVGIIYMALNALLFFMERNRKSRIVKAAVLIIFLWFYALLTGLSPAVLRSAAMLSYIVIGKSIGRYT